HRALVLLIDLTNPPRPTLLSFEQARHFLRSPDFPRVPLPHSVHAIHAKNILNPAKHLWHLRRLIAEIRPMTLSLPIVILVLSLAGCSRSTPPVAHAAPLDAPRVKREVRVTGIVEAVHSSK